MQLGALASARACSARTPHPTAARFASLTKPRSSYEPDEAERKAFSGLLHPALWVLSAARSEHCDRMRLCFFLEDLAVTYSPAS